MRDAVLSKPVSRKDIDMVNLSKKIIHRNSENDALRLLRNQANDSAQAYESGRLELQDAVDRVQDFAVGRGLLHTLGQDRIQAVIAHAFRGRTRR
jgi:hypothetical protein